MRASKARSTILVAVLGIPLASQACANCERTDDGGATGAKVESLPPVRDDEGEGGAKLPAQASTTVVTKGPRVFKALAIDDGGTHPRP